MLEDGATFVFFAERSEAGTSEYPLQPIAAMDASWLAHAALTRYRSQVADGIRERADETVTK